jgi:hypothetical protein
MERAMNGYRVEDWNVGHAGHEDHVAAPIDAAREVPGLRKAFLDMPTQGVDVEVDLPTRHAGTGGGEVIELAARRRKPSSPGFRVA